MDCRNTKPTLSLAPPTQQKGEDHMNSSDEQEPPGVYVGLVKDNSLSADLGHGKSVGARSSASSAPDIPALVQSADVTRNGMETVGQSMGAAEEPNLAKFTVPIANTQRVLKRKKDSATGSSRSHSRPRDVSPSDAVKDLCDSSSTVTLIPIPHLSSRIGQSAQRNSCTTSQVKATQTPSENPQSESLRDCCPDGSRHEKHRSSQTDGSECADPMARRAQVRVWGNQPLSVVDAPLWEIMEREKMRQWKGIELIASENFVSQAVIEALGSHLTNKYSEGLPGSRYYGGNEYIDMIESLCISRALAAFHLDPREWGVNVQPYSCSSANFAVYTALLQPKDRIMGLDVPSGGHVSHGYYTASGKKVAGASIFFESLPYKVDPQNGLIDFDTMEKFALNYRPKILICGGSAYPREWDYARFRNVANKCGSLLMCDMAHIAGLIAAQECASPFDFCDLVTTTTHKSLRGPRGGMIFYRKGLRPRRSGGGPDTMYDFEEKINFAVHPCLQGGPHNNHIAALAVSLKQVATPEYKQYIRQVKKNAQTLASTLMKRGCVLVTGGTDNHLLLWDLRNRGLTGNRLEKVCEMCHMTLNKNAVFGDSSSLGVGGVRIGTPAMTSRGCVEADFEVIANFLMKAVQIAESVQSEHGKLQKDFVRGLLGNREVIELRSRVENFASTFEMPGVEITPKYFSQ